MCCQVCVAQTDRARGMFNMLPGPEPCRALQSDSTHHWYRSKLQMNAAEPPIVKYATLLGIIT